MLQLSSHYPSLEEAELEIYAGDNVRIVVSFRKQYGEVSSNGKNLVIYDKMRVERANVKTGKVEDITFLMFGKKKVTGTLDNIFKAIGKIKKMKREPVKGGLKK